MKINQCCLLAGLASLLLVGCASKTERQFVSGCKASGVDSDICECIYDKLESKYGEDGLKNNMYTFHQTDAFQHDMADTTFQCMKE